MLKEIEEWNSLYYTRNVADTWVFLQEAMLKEGMVEELPFIVEHAKNGEKDAPLRERCLFALCFYYKFGRIGQFYVPGEGMKDKDITRMDIPQEKKKEIKEILEEGKVSEDPYTNYWTNFALRCFCDHFENLND
jgi:hypothetical protein